MGLAFLAGIEAQKGVTLVGFFGGLGVLLIGLGVFDSSVPFTKRNVKHKLKEDEGIVALWFRAKKSQLRKQIKDNEHEDKKL